ncbi:MAG: thioredoxin family protein [bacterium]
MVNKKLKQIVLLTVIIIQLMLLLTLLINCSGKQESTDEKEVKKIAWLHDLDKAKEMAKSRNKPLMIDFYAEWCPPCIKMKDSTFTDRTVMEKSQHFIPVKIDVDKQGDVADNYQSNASKYGGIGIPNILFISPDSIELAHPIGYKNPDEFITIMDSVLVKFKK